MLDASRYGPWAVVAGGSEGVGAAFADQLGAAGLSLLLVARRSEPLAATAAAVRAAHGVEVRTLVLDLLAPGALDLLAREIADLDVGLLVLNAGANSYGSAFVEGDLGRFREVAALNVDVPLALLHHVGARLAVRGRGGLLVVGSLAGYVGHERIAVYAAAKAFSRVLCEGLWLELAPRGVDVLHLVLGVTRTPAMERAGFPVDDPRLRAAAPADVAREGLACLADGPVHVVSGNERTAEVHSGFPRSEVVATAARRMRGLGPSD